MNNTRRQLSLYIPTIQSKVLEEVRKVVDPIQFNLIPAHVTLCRDNEINDLNRLKNKIDSLINLKLELTFDKPKYFNGHGIIMDCIEGEEEFLKLREYILDDKKIKKQFPHITLAHPRNKRSTSNSLTATKLIPNPFRVIFDSISLIEQKNNAPWKIINFD